MSEIVLNPNEKKKKFFSHEAMTDLIAILGSLVDVKGKILVPGINDSVAPLTEEEQKLYEPIDFDPVS